MEAGWEKALFICFPSATPRRLFNDSRCTRPHSRRPCSGFAEKGRWRGQFLVHSARGLLAKWTSKPVYTAQCREFDIPRGAGRVEYELVRTGICHALAPPHMLLRSVSEAFFVYAS